MVQLRRWLLNSSSRVSLLGTLLLAGVAGCQSTREYAASVDSSSQWSTPPLAEPAPSVAKVKPQPAVPYEETPVAVPGPEALFESDSPAPAPAADMNDDVANPRGRKAKKAATFVVDDVAPAPEPVDSTESAAVGNGDTAGTLDDSTTAADPVAASEVSVPATSSVAEEPAASPLESSIELPLPDPAVSAAAALPEATALPDELPSEAIESAIPGLPSDADLVPVLRRTTEPAATLPTLTTPPVAEPTETAPEVLRPEVTPLPESARVRPLFPEATPSRTVVDRTARSRGTTATGRLDSEQGRSTRPKPSGISLPDPMPVTPASSAISGSDVRGVISADVSGHVKTIVTLESEVSGIAFDQHGNLLVTSDEGLSRISPTGSRQDFAAIESPRGFVALPDGSFAVCDARQRSLLRVDRTGSPVEFLAQRSDGHFLRAPSFVAVDSKGGVYFSDPGYARITAPTGRLHYVSADGEVALVSQHLAYPQGVALSADGAKLFLVESQENRVVEFEILSPGRVGPAREFSRLAPKTAGDADDFATGLTADREGRLFVARHGMQRVDVLNANGEFVRSIEVPNVLANSVTLSDDQTSLFVAGAVAKAQWSGVVVCVSATAAR